LDFRIRVRLMKARITQKSSPSHLSLKIVDVIERG
jgi:hypothetical protein